MSTKEMVLDTSDFQVGKLYPRKTVADTGKVPRPIQDRDWKGTVPFANCIVLFVALNKENFDKSIQYLDTFDQSGKIF